MPLILISCVPAPIDMQSSPFEMFESVICTFWDFEICTPSVLGLVWGESMVIPLMVAPETPFRTTCIIGELMNFNPLKWKLLQENMVNKYGLLSHFYIWEIHKLLINRRRWLISLLLTWIKIYMILKAIPPYRSMTINLAISVDG